jgi:hypothetical protein
MAQAPTSTCQQGPTRPPKHRIKKGRTMKAAPPAPAPLPAWAQTKITRWSQMMAIVERVERTPDAIARFQTEANVAINAGMAPAPPPMTAHQAPPNDPRIVASPIDHLLPDNWRFVANTDVYANSVTGGRFSRTEGDMFGRKPIDYLKLKRALGSGFPEPYLLSHYAPDGEPAGLYLSVSADNGCAYTATTTWGAVARKHHKHYYWMTGGLPRVYHTDSDANFAAFDGMSNAVSNFGSAAISAALEGLATQSTP